MSSSLPIPKREAQAKKEIGRTEISPLCQKVLLAGFVLLFLLGTLGQMFQNMSPFRTLLRFPEIAREGWEKGRTEGKSRLFSANRELLSTMNDWETELEDTAWFHQPLLQTAQPLLWRLGSGNGQAVPGKNEWLHYQPDLDFLTQRPFDPQIPAEGIQAFHDALAEMDIQLLVVPVPVKPQIHPETLADTAPRPPLPQPAEDEVFRELERRGIAALDLRQPLAEFAKTAPAYLRTDTHWTPQAMQHAARLTAQWLTDADWISPNSSEPPPQVASQKITHLGDIAVMLGLPEDQTLISPETVEHTQVATPSDTQPRVLLLGDSFSNIFSLEAMGWGADGGFAEHLGARLRQPVRRRVRNDAGASATRHMISRELARGQNPLAGIDIVVWQFAAREWKYGDWDPVPLTRPEPRPLPEPEDPEPDAIQDGGLLDGTEARTVTATVAAVSSIPRPEQVAYANHIATVHLKDVEDEAGTIVNAEAVARFQSMKDRKHLEAARWRPGDRLRLRLVPFSDVEDQYGSLNTSELDDLDLMLATPFWIEETLP